MERLAMIESKKIKMECLSKQYLTTLCIGQRISNPSKEMYYAIQYLILSVYTALLHK